MVGIGAAVGGTGVFATGCGAVATLLGTSGADSDAACGLGTDVGRNSATKASTTNTGTSTRGSSHFLKPLNPSGFFAPATTLFAIGVGYRRSDLPTARVCYQSPFIGNPIYDPLLRE